MKLFSLLFFFLTTAQILTAQIKAVTDNGDEVILNNDGTWKYVDDITKIGRIVDTNKIAFYKNPDATFQVKSSKVENVSIFLNPKKWSFKKGDSGDALEFEFSLKEKDAGGILITERIEMPIENLKEAAFANARKVSADMAVVNEEYRFVNGVKIFFMQMDGTVQGVKFTYLGYYYSGDKGTIQLLTYTAQSLFSEYKKELENLLNGLTVAK